MRSDRWVGVVRMGRRWTLFDALACAYAVLALGFGLFRVLAGPHAGDRVSGGLLMLTALGIGVASGLRTHARIRAGRAAATCTDPDSRDRG